MESVSETLHIELQYSSSGMNTFLVDGLSVDEMNSILNAETFEKQRSILAELLDKHENNYKTGHSLGTCWLCGYGIYNINHFGGHLLVNVGKNCD